MLPPGVSHLPSPGHRGSLGEAALPWPLSAGLRGPALPRSAGETPAVTVVRLGAPATVVTSGTSPRASGPYVGLALGWLEKRCFVFTLVP